MKRFMVELRCSKPRKFTERDRQRGRVPRRGGTFVDRRYGETMALDADEAREIFEQQERELREQAALERYPEDEPKRRAFLRRLPRFEVVAVEDQRG